MKKNLATVLAIMALSFLGISNALAVTAPDATGSFTKCTYTPPSNTGYAAAKVYYPCSSSGTLAATTLTGGYTNTYSDMEWLANHLVTHGYIIFAMTPNNIYGVNSSWTSAHNAGIAQLKKENTRTGTTLSPNPIKGKVNTAKLQIMGFSKGGGGTLLASASQGANIKAAQALAPYMDFTYNLSATKAKTACYTGTADIVAAPSAVVTMYNSLPTTIDRTLGYFNGFLHTDWMTGSYANSNGNKAKKYITAFMKYHIDGDTAYSTYLYGTEHTADMNAGWFYGYSHNARF